MLSRLTQRRLLGLAVATVVLGCLVGLMLGGGAFGANVAAELIGVLAGVAVALVVVDQLVERERLARWRLVAGETESTLRFAMVKAGLELYMLLPAPRPSDVDPFSSDLADELPRAFRRLSQELRDMASSENAIEDAPPLMLDIVRPHVELIRDAVMPRLLIIGPDRDLIRRLASMEAAFENLGYEAWLDNRFGLPSELADAICGLVDTFAEIAERLELMPEHRAAISYDARPLEPAL